MISFFGYAAVFVVVVIILSQIWSMRKFLVYIAVFGILGYFITNYYLKGADMSEGNVKKTTKNIVNKIFDATEKFDNAMERYFANHDREVQLELQQEKLKNKKPDPEPEGFAVSE